MSHRPVLQVQEGSDARPNEQAAVSGVAWLQHGWDRELQEHAAVVFQPIQQLAIGLEHRSAVSTHSPHVNTRQGCTAHHLCV